MNNKDRALTMHAKTPKQIEDVLANYSRYCSCTFKCLKKFF